ncbi:MAG: phage portal protein [Chloroflexota bacterium]
MNETATITQLTNRDADRIRGYQELLDFYHGQQWEGKARWGEKRLTFNYAKVFVDKVTSYLMSGVSWVVEAGEDADGARERARRAKAALDEVYQANGLEQLDLETEIDGATLGDAGYKVIWDGDRKQVRITAPDVQGIYAWWWGDDTSRVWRVASKYRLSAEESQYLYQLKPKGKTASVVELWTDSQFELYLDDTRLEKKPNPYGFIPFIIYPNLREPKRFWGVSDLAQIMESQRELNRAVSQLSRILELSGNPIAVLENVEGSDDIAVRPGGGVEYPGGRQGLPAGPAAGRRRGAAHGLHQPALPHPPRCLRVTAGGLRRDGEGPFRGGPGD